MKYIAILSLFLLCTAAWTCKSNQYTAENMPDKQLCFGTGGGFAGKENRHILLENGQLFYSKLEGAPETMPGIKPKKAADLFSRADTLLSANRVMSPGNTYGFLELRQGDVVKRIAWDNTAQAKDPELQAFYQELLGLVK